MPTLFDTISYGSISAKNRVVMAPLTRCRATKEGVPTELMQTYYEQRADIGLIVTEATGINQEGLGWPYAPGIWSEEQVAHWKPITMAVHDKGGKIVCQLWHMGRAAHSEVTGMQPVSCSPTTHPAKIHVYSGKVDPEQARALTKADIDRLVHDYVQAARNAIEAGFDGVQIHAANGYLMHQFLSDVTNQRTDEYGGSIDNRLRFFKEVVSAVVEAVGADRTGVRFSPNGETHGVYVTEPEPLYVAAAKFLSDKRVAFLALRQNSPTGTFWGATNQPQLHGPIRANFTGKLILNQDYSREEALKDVENGTADAISFGRATMVNTDFVQKLKDNQPLKMCNDVVTWWYSSGPKGYIDWE